MRALVEALLSGNVSQVTDLIHARLDELADNALLELKKEIAYEEYGMDEEDYEEELSELDEANVTKMGRTKLIRVRIRGGKVQRRKKLSSVKGYTFRGGKLTRMSSQERRHRKMTARRAKIKRRAKLKQALRKRKMSLRKRHAMGL